MRRLFGLFGLLVDGEDKLCSTPQNGSQRKIHTLRSDLASGVSVSSYRPTDKERFFAEMR